MKKSELTPFLRVSLKLFSPNGADNHSPLCPFGGFAFLLFPTLVFGLFRLPPLNGQEGF